MPKFEFTRIFRVSMPTVFGLLAAGCSADVARFDFPANASFAGAQTNSIPIPPATVHDPSPRAGLLGDGGTSGGVRVAELPPPSSSYDRGYDAPSSRGYDVAPVRSYDAAPRRDYKYDQPDAARSARRDRGGARVEQVSLGHSAETIEVKPGDTLYSLSRKHGVGVSEIMSSNDLKSHSLKPGQRLRMPGGRGAEAAPAKYETAAAPPATATDASPAIADGPGTYTMKAGDSLYTVARKHNVNFAELQSHNGITDVRKIRPGTVLKIPGQNPGQSSPEPALSAAPAVPATATAASAPAMPAAEAVTSAPAISEPAKSEPVKVETATSDGAPKVLNAAPESPPAAPQQLAAVESKADPIMPSSPPPAASPRSGGDKSASGRLRWPVQGKIISQFGPRPDGTHNDGVNFAVPLGTDVHAAESGEVIYVGDELKAYGKLVLVRHDNGWVTAYAHNDELKVSRGQKVSRGDVVAKAGKSGPVDQPQVHFELRQDSKAVDPTSFMERM